MKDEPEEIDYTEYSWCCDFEPLKGSGPWAEVDAVLHQVSRRGGWVTL